MILFVLLFLLIFNLTNKNKSINYYVKNYIKKYNYSQKYVICKNKIKCNILYSNLNSNKNTKNIFIIHGVLSNSTNFLQNNFLQNIKKYNIYIIDLPNFGISDNFDISKLNIFETRLFYGDIINQIINKTVKNKTDENIIIAHSLGTYLSVWYNYDKVDKFILLSPCGIFHTLGKYGYYYALIFKYVLHFFYKLIRIPINYFNFFNNIEYHIFYRNKEHIGLNILYKLIEANSKYGFWKYPMIKRLNELSKKSQVFLVFGENDKIMPPDIGVFVNRCNRNIKSYKVKNNYHSCYNCNNFTKILNDILKEKKTKYKCKNNFDKILKENSKIKSNLNIFEIERKLNNFYNKSFL